MIRRGSNALGARRTLVMLLCVGIAAGMTACQVFDGETTDTSEYECPSLMPIMTPDGSCTASLDDALAMVESMDDPELLISPGDYTISRTITKPITFRSSRARAFPRPDVTSFERIDCAIVPGTIGHGLGAKAIGLEHEPKIILRAADPAEGIVIDMADGAHRMILIGAELHGKDGGPVMTVRKGKLGIVQSRVFEPIKMTGTKSRLLLDGVRVSGAVSSLIEGDVIDGEDAWSLYDVGGSCDDALLVVDDGAIVNAVGLELANHSPLGLCVDNAQATLCGGSIHDIAQDDENRLGRGAHVQNGGKLSLRGVDLYAVHDVGVWAKGSGTELTLEQDAEISEVVLMGMALSGVSYSAMSLGIAMDEGASLVIQDAIISDIEGPGIWLTGGSSATIDGLTIASAQAAGIAVFDATIALSSSTITDTAPASNVGGGYGISVDATALGPATVEISDTTISDSQANGIVVNGDGSSVRIIDSVISTGTVGSHYDDGFGILAADVCSGLILDGVAFDSNAAAHIFLDGSNVTLSAITFNTTGCSDADYFSMNCSNSCVTAPSLSELSAAGITEPPNTIIICSSVPYPADHESLKINIMPETPACPEC